MDSQTPQNKAGLVTQTIEVLFPEVIAAVDMVNRLVPLIREAFASGEITMEQQLLINTKFEELRNNTGALYSGDEWKKSDGSKSGSQT